MNTKAIISATVTAIVATVLIAQPALAWHPKGVIVKKAYNVTAGGALKDANTVGDAVIAKPGDVVRYVIEVSNTAAAAEKQHNDMDFVVLTDNLPAGVEPVTGTSYIRENLGLIVPQKKVVKQYDVKVTSQKDGAIITNEACFTGDSVVKDNPQSGCDKAIIKVQVPEVPKTPEQPKPEPKPETPAPKVETPAPEQPQALPQTGMEVFGAAAGTSVVGYAASAYLRSKRALGKAFRK